ncbi:Uncharacterised protein [Acinetobacter baumannii]|nr:Uncharacterised protein [Acinetobacter baumannii]
MYTYRCNAFFWLTFDYSQMNVRVTYLPIAIELK